MLKLELSHQRQEIAVRMRTRETLWTKGLLRALGITLFLHLTGYLFFHIQDSGLDEIAVIRPIEVIADIGGVTEADAGTYAVTRGEQGLMSRYILEPEQLGSWATRTPRAEYCGAGKVSQGSRGWATPVPTGGRKCTSSRSACGVSL